MNELNRALEEYVEFNKRFPGEEKTLENGEARIVGNSEVVLDELKKERFLNSGKNYTDPWGYEPSDVGLYGYKILVDVPLNNGTNMKNSNDKKGFAGAFHKMLALYIESVGAGNI